MQAESPIQAILLLVFACCKVRRNRKRNTAGAQERLTLKWRSILSILL
jgi:hypothetical protein